MIVMATMPTNAKVMRRDLIDPLCSVLRMSANLLLSAACSLELDVSKPAVFHSHAMSQHSLQDWLRPWRRSMTGKSGSKMTRKPHRIARIHAAPDQEKGRRHEPAGLMLKQDSTEAQSRSWS